MWSKTQALKTCSAPSLPPPPPVQMRNQKPHTDRKIWSLTKAREKHICSTCPYICHLVCLPIHALHHLPKLQKLHVSNIYLYWKEIMSSRQKLPSTAANWRETEWMAFFPVGFLLLRTGEKVSLMLLKAWLNQNYCKHQYLFFDHCNERDLFKHSWHICYICGPHSALGSCTSS